MQGEIEGYLATKGQWRKQGDEWIGYCPACNARHERSLSVNVTTGQWVCNRKNNCGKSGGINALRELYGDRVMTKLLEFTPRREYKDPTHNARKLKPDGLEFLHSRGLDDLTIGAWKVGQEQAFYRKLNTKGEGIVWPVYDGAGKLVNLKGRCLLVKDFTNKAGCAQWPVGLHLVDTERCGTRLILTEGELDAMAGHQMGLRNIVSLPNGAGDQTWIDLAWDWLARFDTIALCLDADKAGSDAKDRIIRRLGFRWRIVDVTLPDGRKDLNECLMAGDNPEVIRAAIDNGREVRPEHINSAEFYTERVLDRLDRRQGMTGTPSGFRRLDELLRGFRDSELTVWTGQSGSGKSTVLGMASINAITHGVRTCISSLELPPDQYLSWLTLQATGEEQPGRFLGRRAMKWLGTGLIMVDQVGSVELPKLLEDWAYCAQRFGCRSFIADSLQCIDAGADETAGQRTIIKALVQFAHQYRCHVHLVAHPRKTEADNHDLNQVDVKGNKAVTDLAHNIIGVLKGETATTLKVLKNREFGTTGKAGVCISADCKQVFDGSGPPDFGPWISEVCDGDIPDVPAEWLA